MAKHIKAYINLAGKGSHDYVGLVAFEHSNSDSLRIKEIRLKASGSDRPLRVPVNLLTWFTKQVAGREITRDENEQQEKAALYADLAALKELVDTCALKTNFLLEVEISELDRNDDSQLRSDQGLIEIEINLYKGPQANCSLKTTSLLNEESELVFPIDCGKNGRFNLLSAELTSKDSPLNPETDKRILISYIELEPPFAHLHHLIEQRLKLYEKDVDQAYQIVSDTHHYAELFPDFPLDPEHPLPSAATVFGPLMPSHEKETDKMFFLSVMAPPRDPFWQILREEVWQVESSQQQKPMPLCGFINIIVPEPGATIHKKIPFKISQTKSNCLILADAAGVSSPLIIPFDTTEQELSPSYFEVEVSALSAEASLTTMLNIQYYCLSDKVTPLNIAFKPNKKDSEKSFIKPEIIELAANQQEFLLLNHQPETADGLNEEGEESKFDVRLFWPENDFKQNLNLAIKFKPAEKKRYLAVDIGSKAITIISNDTFKNNDDQQSKKTVSNTKLQARQLQSNISLTGTENGSNKKNEHNSIADVSWRATHYPFSISFSLLNGKENDLANRLQIENRHYDIAVPGNNPLNELNFNNLRRLFLTPKTYLAATNAKYLLSLQADDNSANNSDLILQNEINLNWLLEDCLDELCNFYASYLPSPELEKDNLLKPLELILTYSSEAPPLAKRRYKKAAAKFIKRYEYGSFFKLGAIGELLNLPSNSSLQGKAHLLSDSLASAYYALKIRAENHRPSRCKKIHQIHFDIGGIHCEAASLTAMLGESNTQLEEVHGQISLPMGGEALELALTKEIAAYLETALSKTPLLSWQVNLPLSPEEICAAENPVTENEILHNHFLISLRQTITSISSKQHQSENDLQITLATNEMTPPNFELDQSIISESESVRLWNGLRGEQLVFSPDLKNNGWQLNLFLSSKVISERVGPLSTYLAFIAEFLPRTIINSLPKSNEPVELYFSITGGLSLFPPLQAMFTKTASELNCTAFFKPFDYQEATSAVAQGALAFVESKAHHPYRRINPNLLLAPLTSHTDNQEFGLNQLSENDLALISDPQVTGKLPESITRIQLIETISGLNTLLKNDPEAIQCRTYLNDLDRASELQWQQAEEQWEICLENCYQLLLNMPFTQEAGVQEKRWDYIALKENEARLKIAGHDYFLSSGLRASGH